MRDNRRYERRDNMEHGAGDPDARWLHGHHQGENSDRRNYTIDTHFNRGYGRNEYSQFGDSASFNENADYRQMSGEGRFAPGGAQYAGEDFTRRNRESDNPYGMSYVPNDGYNSGRHYDARADYSDQDYSDMRSNREPHTRYRIADEGFGHDVRSGRDNDNWARGSMGDYESYRRYEMGNRNYDNDYSGGFADRNYTPGATHYGEGSYNSEMDRWQSESQQKGKRGNR
ncbi:hypothetical protein ABID22_002925 [Pontibacter aydingkolensis]|uniref:SWFGD domain-containing protein n=1 Tax=Pontibacter aydingkolensis TaxID=1911536 RepID=A0ABS7CXI6_9BACT|nr:hypothetical protein [Pontibacter aydingkolensis]MBW7468508.1 hypothetical protein [Pontibacter aydingkolensis]